MAQLFGMSDHSVPLIRQRRPGRIVLHVASKFKSRLLFSEITILEFNRNNKHMYMPTS